MTENTPNRLEELKAATAEAETARTAFEEKQDAYNTATSAREKKEVEIKQAAEDSGIKAALEDLGNKLKDLTTKFTGPEPEKKAFAKAVKTILRETSLRPIPNFKDLNTCLTYTPDLDAWKNFLQGTTDKQVPDEQKSRVREALQEVHSAYERLKKEREDYKNAHEKLQAAEKAAKVAAISAETALRKAESRLSNAQATLNAPSAPAYVPKEAPAPELRRAPPSQPIASILAPLLSNKAVGWGIVVLFAVVGIPYAPSISGSSKALSTQQPTPHPRTTPTARPKARNTPRLKPTPSKQDREEQRVNHLYQTTLASHYIRTHYKIILKKMMIAQVEAQELFRANNPKKTSAPNWYTGDLFIQQAKMLWTEDLAKPALVEALGGIPAGIPPYTPLSKEARFKVNADYQKSIDAALKGNEDDILHEYYPDLLYNALWFSYLIENASDLKQKYPEAAVEYALDDVISTLTAAGFIQELVGDYLLRAPAAELVEYKHLSDAIITTLNRLLPEDTAQKVKAIVGDETLNTTTPPYPSRIPSAYRSYRPKILRHSWLTFSPVWKGHQLTLQEALLNSRPTQQNTQGKGTYTPNKDNTNPGR